MQELRQIISIERNIDLIVRVLLKLSPKGCTMRSFVDYFLLEIHSRLLEIVRGNDFFFKQLTV